MNLFTSDIDWAPEEVIADTLSLFSKYNVKCTFFCTHESNVINSIKSDKNFELGIHPNFLPLMNNKEGSINEAFDKVLNIVPDAKGIRSHSLVQSTPLIDIIKEYGLKYEANSLLPYKKDINPIKLWNGIIKVMHNFEDDIHFMYNHSFNDTIIKQYASRLNVYCMHPIHIFLNTDTQQTYDSAKKYYHEPKELIKHRNTSKFGTRDLLIQLLENHYEHFNNSFTVYNYLQNENII